MGEKARDRAVVVERLMPLILRNLFGGDDPLSELPVGQLRLLRAVQREEPISPSTLAEKLHLTPGAISQHLTKLKTAGYIEEIANDEDRRSKSLVLTTSGKETLLARSVDRVNRTEAVLRTMPSEDQDLIVRALRLLADHSVGGAVEDRTSNCKG